MLACFANVFVTMLWCIIGQIEEPRYGHHTRRQNH